MNHFLITYTDGGTYYTESNGTLEEFTAYLTQNGGTYTEENQVTGEETRRVYAKIEQVEQLGQLDELRALVLEQTRAKYLADGFPHAAESLTVKTHYGKKYNRIDVGPAGNMSGRYMVERDTGRIYGIKAYGVIHRGHYYGTLDTIHEYNWGGYTAVKL